MLKEGEPAPGKPGPVQGVLALLDPLLRRATAIVEAGYALGWIPEKGAGGDPDLYGPKCADDLQPWELFTLSFYRPS